MLLKFLQSLNKLSLIVLIPPGIVIFSKEEQPSNTYAPMLVQVSGIVMFCKLEQTVKAKS
uniref:Uncharacterized protein n=1 Tax=viral metagenome TaxID=1070528 RepID=A0A6C0F4A3_9ZZZZ